MSVKQKIMFTITEVNHLGNVSCRQLTVAKDSKDHVAILKKYPTSKIWGSILVGYIVEKRISFTLIKSNA